MALPVLHKVTFGATTDFYYVKTSDAYEGLKDQTGFEKVADPLGTEEVIPIKELIRTGTVWRIGIRYKDSNGKMKTSRLLVARGKLAGLFGDVAASKLEDKDYKIAGVTKGKIERISGIRKATFH
ncbi:MULTISPECIES: hypothetical protein [unclassified Nostoc]|uniref:hypothetical protein n=1 Tax=unclassified Nostoc TaxID=2593658 RepID=UPI002AD1E596|nr:hypothetical protein [Nostoc sp. DedQUE03]MDZ7971277.1 hypothetical protein [Nostoc sp. DedQUE03]MDZ8045469.1 hypothetical protein [Nostoc sp. DedQUE02]